MAEKNIIKNDDEDGEDESVSPLGCLVMVAVLGLGGFLGYRGCEADKRRQTQRLQEIVLTQTQEQYIHREIVDECFVPEGPRRFWAGYAPEKYCVKIKSNTKEYSLDLRPTNELNLKLLDLTFNKGDKVKFPKYLNAKEAGYDSEAIRFGISLESYVKIERFSGNSGILNGDLLLKDSN